MIQELKRRPITFNGVDGWEILVKDDELEWEDEWVCRRCMYLTWDDYEGTLSTCDIVHGCLPDYQTYYKFETEPDK